MKMKRLILIVLSVAVLFSMMAGCTNGAKESEPSAKVSTEPEKTTEKVPDGEITKEMLQKSKPGEYIPEKLDAGMEVILGYAPIADNFFTNQILGEGIRSYVEPLGMKYIFANADEDTALQISQIENFVQMGAAMVVILPIDANVVKQTVLNAQDAGTHIVIFGVECKDYDSIVATYDNVEIGVQVSLMARAWMDIVYPDAPDGSIEAAAIGTGFLEDSIKRTVAIEETLRADPRINIVYSTDNCNGIDEGFTRAEEAFTVSSNIKVLTTPDVGSAIGINNYLLTLKNVDVSSMGLFCAGIDNTLPELLEAAAKNEGFLRGTIQDGENTYDGTVACIEGIINGSITKPYTFYQPMFSRTEANFTYHYDSREL